MRALRNIGHRYKVTICKFPGSGPGLARQHNRGVTPERSLAAANSDGGDGAPGVTQQCFLPGGLVEARGLWIQSQGLWKIRAA